MCIEYSYRYVHCSYEYVIVNMDRQFDTYVRAAHTNLRDSLTGTTAVESGPFSAGSDKYYYYC